MVTLGHPGYGTVGDRAHDRGQLYCEAPQAEKLGAPVLGAQVPTSARPADCEEPRHNPARLAATQKSPGPEAAHAISVVPIQRIRVRPTVRTCPRRSWM